MADDLECDICCEVYDEQNHRPKNLPCGHTFCSHCMAREINNAKGTCATCRKPHNARSVADLPTSVTLERFIRNKQSNKRQKTEPSASGDEEDEENGGRCPTHSKSLLYFHCETHSKKVCRECTVIDHRVDRCRVISFKQMVERQRNLGILKADKNTRFINAIMNNLGESIEYHKKIESKQRLYIKRYQKEIDIATAKCGRSIEDQANARNLMNQEEALRDASDTAKLKLQNANTKKEMDKAIDEIENVSEEIQNWTKDADRASSEIAKNNKYGGHSSYKVAIDDDMYDVTDYSDSDY